MDLLRTQEKECVKTYACGTGAPAAVQVSSHNKDVEGSESAVRGLEVKAPVVSEDKTVIIGAKGGNVLVFVSPGTDGV